ncbi:MAG: hypothetical protein HC876_15455, partial [Chloroflexaceae bacterium]|nr:hypothetical protein [Chloroflexaceae bacterium]
MTTPTSTYIAGWRRLGLPAWLYLLHAGLLTSSLAMSYLVFNLAVVALDAPPIALLGLELELLGILGSLSILTAMVAALPLLWFVTRVGFWWPLVANALLQAGSVGVITLSFTPAALICSAILTGIGGALFQLSSVPFISRISDDTTRDHLFSANFAANIALAGLGSLVAGSVAVGAARLLAVPPGSLPAYQVVFAVATVLLLLSVGPLFLLRRVAATPARVVAPPAATVAAAVRPGRYLVGGGVARTGCPWRRLV